MPPGPRPAPAPRPARIPRPPRRRVLPCAPRARGCGCRSPRPRSAVARPRRVHDPPRDGPARLPTVCGRVVEATGRRSRERYPQHELALHYESIKRGIQKASEIRVQEMAEDYPWVPTILSTLRGMNVPATVQRYFKLARNVRAKLFIVSSIRKDACEERRFYHSRPRSKHHRQRSKWRLRALPTSPACSGCQARC